MTTVDTVTVTRACIIYKAGIARMTVITEIFMFEPGLGETHCTETRIQHSSYRQCHRRTQWFINVARSLRLSWYWSTSSNASHTWLSRAWTRASYCSEALMLVVEPPFNILSCYHLKLWYHHSSLLYIAFINSRNMHIQGVTGGTDQTSGECSLGHTIPI